MLKFPPSINNVKSKEIIEKYWSRLRKLVESNEKMIGENSLAHLRTRSRAIEYLHYMPYIFERVPLKSSVLDWGAQHGHVSLLLRLIGMSPIPYVVCPPPQVVKSLNELFSGEHVSSTEPITLPFKSVSIDAVVSSGVLEHVEEYGGNVAQSVAEIARVLKQGGFFFIWKLPVNASISEIKSDLFGGWSHDTRFSSRQIRRILEKGGFSVDLCIEEGLLPLRVKAVLRAMRCVFIENFIDSFAQRWPMKIFATDLFVIAKKL